MWEIIVYRFLFEEGSPANQFYKKCMSEMRSTYSLQEADHATTDRGAEADVEEADGKNSSHRFI